MLSFLPQWLRTFSFPLGIQELLKNLTWVRSYLEWKTVAKGAERVAFYSVLGGGGGKWPRHLTFGSHSQSQRLWVCMLYYLTQTATGVLPLFEGTIWVWGVFTMLESEKEDWLCERWNGKADRHHKWSTVQSVFPLWKWLLIVVSNEQIHSIYHERMQTGGSGLWMGRSSSLHPTSRLSESGCLLRKFRPTYAKCITLLPSCLG